ncbi:hypothetical protein LPJ66_003703, partial [Kickxella alabastrina]
MSYSTLPTRRPRHRGHKQRESPKSFCANSNPADNVWPFLPCLPRDIIESTQYEFTLVGRGTHPRRNHNGFAETQMMSIAMVLAEQYVREAEPFPLFDSKSSLECIDDDEDVIKFANAQWGTDPRYDSLVSLCPVSTISLAQSPRLSERSCAPPPEPVADPVRLGFLTLPVRSVRACTTSSGGSTAVGSVMLEENSNSGAE